MKIAPPISATPSVAIPAKGPSLSVVSSDARGTAPGDDRYRTGDSGTLLRRSGRFDDRNGTSFQVRNALAAYDRQRGADSTAGTGANSGSPVAEGSDREKKGDGAGERSGGQVERGAAAGPLTDQELQQLAALRSRDAEVKAHEMAHLAAAGAYARGGASFQYQNGPDGRQYAVGGEVSIDTGRERTPAATITKMAVVRAAALAPADPSPQDRAVAAAATSAMGRAREELRQEQLVELQKIAPGKGLRGAGEPAPTPAGGAEGESGGPGPPPGYQLIGKEPPAFRAVA
ncbi:MAG: putative metalloprotease CJM1_0395 family protein [Thermodesulfobacteriota bacterium]